eukprot:gene57652-biopygen89352
MPTVLDCDSNTNGWSYWKPQTTAPPNLAAGKMTAQSSTEVLNGIYRIGSERAVDGNTDPSFSGNSCTSTVDAHRRGEADPWWRVDLGEQYYVCTVRITNRGDCCADRLDGFEVRAGETEGDGTANHNCGNGGHTPVRASAWVDVDCGEQLARYCVRMHNANDGSERRS